MRCNPRFLLLLGTPPFTAPTSARAQNARWIRIDRTPELALYVDRFRKQIKDEIADVWASWEFTSRQPLVDKQFDRMVAHYRLDCRQARSMQLEATFYLGAAFVIHIPTPDPQLEWASATPQSINETLVIRGCLIAKGRPTERVP